MTTPAPDEGSRLITVPLRAIDVRNAEINRLRDDVARLTHERTLLIEAGRRWLALAWSLPGGQYPTSAEVRSEAGLPIE